MDTLTLVILIAAAVLAAAIVFIATRSPRFRLERATTIAAPPERVFPHINDFHAWKNWSPWEGLDPNLQRTFSGAPQGTGAIYDWTGNKQVGAGRMTIQKSEPNAVVQILLEFFRPFKATNVTTFVLGREGADATRVTWAMEGSLNFVTKAVHLFMNMEKFVGNDFEKGLAALKQQVEAR